MGLSQSCAPYFRLSLTLTPGNLTLVASANCGLFGSLYKQRVGSRNFPVPDFPRTYLDGVCSLELVSWGHKSLPELETLGHLETFKPGALNL